MQSPVDEHMTIADSLFQDEEDTTDIFQAAGFDGYRVVAYTQTASDAISLCAALVLPQAHLVLEKGAYVAGRGPLRLYGSVDAGRARRPRGPSIENVKTVSMPRYSAPDVADFWKTETAMPLDDAALKTLDKLVVCGSVIILETVANHVYDGALSAYFLLALSRLCSSRGAFLIMDETLLAIRCGRLWSFDFLNRRFECGAVVFGKAMYASGVCVPRRGHKAMRDMIGVSSRHAYAPVTIVAANILKKAHAILDGGVDDEIQRFRRFVRDTVAFQFEDIQWFGFIAGAKLRGSHYKSTLNAGVEPFQLRGGNIEVLCVRFSRYVRLIGWVLDELERAPTPVI